jgi:hypothetical protein
MKKASLLVSFMMPFFFSLFCKSKEERHEVAADLVVFTIIKKE